MKIIVYGFSNKQHIFYSLFKILGHIGRVLFITTNPQYCQFSEDCVSTDFELESITFQIVSDTIWNAEYEPSEYDFIIIDAMIEVIGKEQQDIAILCDHADMYRESLDIFSDTEDAPIVYIQEGAGVVDKTDKVVNFIPAEYLSEAIQRTESERIFQPMYNRKHARVMAKILKDITGCSITEIKKYLKKKGVGELENYGDQP